VSDEFDSIEEVDETVEQLADLLREEQSDLAVAIDTILEATQEADDDADPDDVAENVTLPFYEDDREIAFTIGLTTGALLEAREYVEDDDEDAQTETVAVGAEQSQSVTVEA
jgi:hypothetical protein